jgi:hypothetical protein
MILVPGGALLLALGIGLWRAKLTRVFLVLPWSLVAFVTMALIARGSERQVVLTSALLTMAEVVIVTAVAMLFSSFSSPFLTTIFTIMLFLIGRSTDTLANLPANVFGAAGPAVHTVGVGLSKVVPNLYLYVPSRPVLLGQVPQIPIAPYILSAWGNALLYAVVLIAVSAIVFRRRDFE